MIIPSIDLMNGKAVQLIQGKEKVLERENVIDLAREFSKYGEIAVIDLDAALGKGNNIDLIKQICKIADCRVGGGIRDKEKADELLRAGAKKIIIGTKATPEFLENLPTDRVIVAVDTKNGFVVDKGWTNNTGKTAKECVKELENYCCGFLYTIVDKEGCMKGTDVDAIKALQSITNKRITAAGGISSIDEIKLLDGRGIDCQLGMAIYTGKIKLNEAFISLLDFEKNNGLIPTVVQNVNKDVLMVAYSNKESLLQALKTNKSTYFSRSRQKIWQKGETSGNRQELVNVKYDCDKDTLLFMVKQNNVACHSGRYSCFFDKEFSFDDLYELMLDRINNPKQGSYTAKLIENNELLKKKINEEAFEVITAGTKDELVWEVADLTYFVMVLMAKNGITIDNIRKELWGRRK